MLRHLRLPAACAIAGLSVLGAVRGAAEPAAMERAGPKAMVAATQPFAIGERAEYDVKYGVLHAGTGVLEVVGIDTVRGHDAYHFRMTITGGVNALLYKYTIRDTTDSWVDTTSFHSLRFVQSQWHRGKPRHKNYEIFPDRQVYVDGDQPERPSVADPLDDIATLYFARQELLTVGQHLEIPRYFKPERNPITLTVVGADTIDVMGHKWPTLVVQPIIPTSTMFGDGQARVWLANDSTRTIVQIKARASIGSVTMKLKALRLRAEEPSSSTSTSPSTAPSTSQSTAPSGS